MNKVKNPCLADITGIVRILYDRGVICFDDMKGLFTQIGNTAWQLYGSDGYKAYIDEARHAATVCESFTEFKRKVL